MVYLFFFLNLNLRRDNITNTFGKVMIAFGAAAGAVCSGVAVYEANQTWKGRAAKIAANELSEDDKSLVAIKDALEKIVEGVNKRESEIASKAGEAFRSSSDYVAKSKLIEDEWKAAVDNAKVQIDYDNRMNGINSFINKETEKLRGQLGYDIRKDEYQSAIRVAENRYERKREVYKKVDPDEWVQIKPFEKARKDDSVAYYKTALDSLEREFERGKSRIKAEAGDKTLQLNGELERQVHPDKVRKNEQLAELDKSLQDYISSARTEAELSRTDEEVKALNDISAIRDKVAVIEKKMDESKVKITADGSFVDKMAYWVAGFKHGNAAVCIVGGCLAAVVIFCTYKFSGKVVAFRKEICCNG